LANQNRVFKVVAFPRHKSNQNIPPQSKFPVVRRMSVSQDVVFSDNFALFDKRSLVYAGALIAFDEFFEFVSFNFFVRTRDFDIICRDFRHPTVVFIDDQNSAVTGNFILNARPDNRGFGS
jgi:hypothetical protein